jgi:hypothetical protein
LRDDIATFASAGMTRQEILDALKLALARTAPPDQSIKPRRKAAANGNGSSNGKHTHLAEAKTLALSFWRTAEARDGGKPWRVVSSEFGVNEALCLDARRHCALPPGVSAEAAAYFIEA